MRFRISNTPNGQKSRSVVSFTTLSWTYRTFIRLGVNEVAWHARLGRLAEQQGQYREAEQSYRRIVLLRPESAKYHYRLGRMLQRQGRFSEAEESYGIAIELNPDRDSWLLRYARLKVTQQHWVAAISCYNTLVERNPADLATRLALGKLYEDHGDPLAAIEVYRQGGDDPVLLRRLALSYEVIGNWQAASETIRAELALNEGDPALLFQLSRILDLQQRVPLNCVGHVAVRARLDSRVYREAVDVFDRAQRATPEPLSPRMYYRLGRMHERFGDFAPALAAYHRALDELEEVDAAWRNSIEPAWQFRRDYVAARVDGDDGTDPRTLRSALPVAPDPLSEQDPTGFFEAMITYEGLRVEGFLAPGLGENVDLYIDDTYIETVELNHRKWRPSFVCEISHSTLAEFPPSALLTVRVQYRPLLVVGGGSALRLENPGGAARLAELIAAGYRISKKGTLAAPEAEINERQLVYVKAYSEVRDRLEELLGKKLFLLYGTLLGCYRDGSFIAGDDDFDVAYISNATSPAELKEELLKDALALLRSGYDVGTTMGGRLFKIRMHGIWIDVNPIWFHRGAAWGFNRHQLPRAAFEPIRRMMFLDHEVYVPNDVEAFLADNYGESWGTPQPGFRYYRREEHMKVMRRSWLTPTELADFSRLVESELRDCPAAGRFVGIQDTAGTGFVR